MEFKDVVSLILTLLTIAGTVIGAAAAIYRLLRKPYDKLDARVTELEGHKAGCAKIFGKDKDAIDQMRRDLNHTNNDVSYVKRVLAFHEEGINLTMQHDIKGNHTSLLEQWMRDSAKIHIYPNDRRN